MIDYCIQNNKQACVSRLEYFGDAVRIQQKLDCYEPFYEKYKGLSKENEYNLLLKQCVLPAPSLIMSRKILEEINYLDESYTFYEEWPTYMSILDRGYDIPYIEDRLVKYRCEQACLSAGAQYDKSIKGQTYRVARSKVIDDAWKFYFAYRRPRLIKRYEFLYIWEKDIEYQLYRIAINEKQSALLNVKEKLYRLIWPRTYSNAYKYLSNKGISAFCSKLRSFFS